MSCKGCEERREKMRVMYEYSRKRLRDVIAHLTADQSEQSAYSESEHTDRTEQPADTGKPGAGSTDQ